MRVHNKLAFVLLSSIGALLFHNNTKKSAICAFSWNLCEQAFSNKSKCVLLFKVHFRRWACVVQVAFVKSTKKRLIFNLSKKLLIYIKVYESKQLLTSDSVVVVVSLLPELPYKWSIMKPFIYSLSIRIQCAYESWPLHMRLLVTKARLVINKKTTLFTAHNGQRA